MEPSLYRQTCVLQALGPHEVHKDKTPLFLCGKLTGGNALAAQAAHMRQEHVHHLDTCKSLNTAEMLQCILQCALPSLAVCII